MTNTVPPFSDERNSEKSFFTSGWLYHLLHVEMMQCFGAMLFVLFLAVLTFYGVLRMQGFSYGQA
ncbi:hypothetical protein FAI41_07450 [Acetobacteraceae bacterium]|nr:hypothetical protein FAI41_07450 [Acetobacteraceae bacterium]